MKKYLVRVEFRFNTTNDEGERVANSRRITIGVYDTFEKAAYEGNGFLINMENWFARHRYPHGGLAAVQRFSSNGGAFGSKKMLVTNLAYLKTPFDFYAKIERLDHVSPADTVTDILSQIKKVN